MMAFKNHVICPPYSYFLSDLISHHHPLCSLPSSRLCLLCFLLIQQALARPLAECSPTDLTRLVPSLPSYHPSSVTFSRGSSLANPLNLLFPTPSLLFSGLFFSTEVATFNTYFIITSKSSKSTQFFCFLYPQCIEQCLTYTRH